jgi:hypothetical protein
MSDRPLLSRREWLAHALGAVAGLAATGSAAFLLEAAPGAPPIPMTVHKDKSCACCEKWVSHVRASGFQVTVRDEPDIDGVKDQLGVPKAVRSCHTALVGGYLIEGHVPASDVKRLLQTRARVVGLTVPGMPSGTPGMEGPKGKEPYEVLSFDARGKTAVYRKH